MPELPEVETVIRDLRSKILDNKISRVDVLLPRIIKNRVADFKKALIRNRFVNIDRIGKLIVLSLEKAEKKVLVHLKMTGQLVYAKDKKVIAGGHDDGADPNALPNKWTRAIFVFADGSKLYFNDLRTFGYIKLVDKDELEEIEKGFGEDPLGIELTLYLFKKKIKQRNATIKAVLLNQQIVAGLGNIYVDEILFRAGVRPTRKASGLKNKEIEAIYESIKPILNKAIKARGTTFNSFVDGEGNQGGFSGLLKVYARAGEKCVKCGKEIRKIKVAGRGTHFCMICQK